MQISIRMAATWIAIGLASCGGSVKEAENPVVDAAGRLVVSIDRAETAADGRRCILHVTARNDTGKTALNVQLAWMAQTDGFGSISDYQVLGDFAAEEVRALQLGIFGAPCDAVQSVKQSRAVCTVESVDGTPGSCADLVMLKDNRGEGGNE